MVLDEWIQLVVIDEAIISRYYGNSFIYSDDEVDRNKLKWVFNCYVSRLNNWFAHIVYF